MIGKNFKVDKTENSILGNIFSHFLLLKGNRKNEIQSTTMSVSARRFS